eukprot:GHVS01095313.1.p1 GENE.GHVS01095313.1~~GHVS01095313.1.p1  ORF type:complete len:313 (-),score=55.78 GHVS01095313.1:359-1297(-)
MCIKLTQKSADLENPRVVMEVIKTAMTDLLDRDDLPYSQWEEVATAVIGSSREQMEDALGLRVACLLGMMRMKGESFNALFAFSNKLREASETPANPTCLDIVGTGGDGHNTINISTGSAIVAAACGVHVMKVGSTSITSSAGASDVLTSLLNLSSSLPLLTQSIASHGIAFCAATTATHIRRLRRSVGVPTIFNLVGPLVNMGKAGYRMIGVCDPKLLLLFARVVQRDELTRRALIFHSQGLDELSPVGTADVVEVTEDKTIKEWTFDPTDYHIPFCSIGDLKVGNCCICCILLLAASYCVYCQLLQLLHL